MDVQKLEVQNPDAPEFGFQMFLGVCNLDDNDVTKSILDNHFLVLYKMTTRFVIFGYSWLNNW